MFNLKNNTIIGNPKGYLFKAPRADRPNRRERFWYVQCNGCGTKRYLRKSDILKDTYCRRCAGVISATGGSAIEDQVAAELKKRHVKFERHFPLLDVGYNIDFYLPDYNVFIEVIGYWHKRTKYIKDKVLQSKYAVFFVTKLSDIEKIFKGKYHEN